MTALARPGRHRHDPPSPLPRLDAQALERASRLFRSLGDAPRLLLLGLLAHGERCVSELAEATEAGMSTVSQRLRVLRGEGLVTRRRDGKHIRYALADAHVTELVGNALAHVAEPRPARPPRRQGRQG